MKLTYPLLIDGGLSNEVERHGCDINHKLWSAKLLISNPEAIIKAHEAYLEAGAECIITASYQATYQGFMDQGYTEKEAGELILESVELAQEAIRRYMIDHGQSRRPMIAASIGPYGAYLSDGSEYRGDYKISDTQLSEFHRGRFEVLDSSAADFLAFETIPSFQEAKVLASLLTNSKKDAWLSFSCSDGNHINDGTSLEECIPYFAENKKIFALGVNCTRPEFVSDIILTIKKLAPKKRIVVYPNSGQIYDATTKTWHGTTSPQPFAQMTKEWMNLGADIVGGCCQIGSEHIKLASANFNT